MKKNYLTLKELKLKEPSLSNSILKKTWGGTGYEDEFVNLQEDTIIIGEDLRWQIISDAQSDAYHDAMEDFYEQFADTYNDYEQDPDQNQDFNIWDNYPTIDYSQATQGQIFSHFMNAMQHANTYGDGKVDITKIFTNVGNQSDGTQFGFDMQDLQLTIGGVTVDISSFNCSTFGDNIIDMGLYVWDTNYVYEGLTHEVLEGSGDFRIVVIDNPDTDFNEAQIVWDWIRGGN